MRVRLAMDYFSLGSDEFMSAGCRTAGRSWTRQTTPDRGARSSRALNNPEQQRIVTDDREQTNVLVLAGPGSGKTACLVHRIAYLVRVRRENPRGDSGARLQPPCGGGDPSAPARI